MTLANLTKDETLHVDGLKDLKKSGIAEFDQTGWSRSKKGSGANVESVGVAWRGRPTYTHQQVVAAGGLVDLSETGAVHAHWAIPLFCTPTVYALLEETIAWESCGLDVVLDRVFRAAKQEIDRCESGRIGFASRLARRERILQLVFTLGDDGLPMLTLQIPGERSYFSCAA